MKKTNPYRSLRRASLKDDVLNDTRFFSRRLRKEFPTTEHESPDDTPLSNIGFFFVALAVFGAIIVALVMTRTVDVFSAFDASHQRMAIFVVPILTSVSLIAFLLLMNGRVWHVAVIALMSIFTSLFAAAWSPFHLAWFNP